MSESPQQLKLRIKSVENTRKTTSAMQIVSAAKLKRIGAMHAAALPYASNLIAILERLAGRSESSSHPFFTPRHETGRVAACIITSDAGLCGTYNYMVTRRALEFIEKQGGSANVDVITVGKEGEASLKKTGIKAIRSFNELHGRYSKKSADEIAAVLVDLFISGKVDEVYAIYGYSESLLRRIVVIEKILNIDPSPTVRSGESCIFEPTMERVLDQIAPQYVSVKMRLVLLEALRTEHTSRMIAMNTATDNADELIKNLTLFRNKARQAMITKEILEISSTAEALKG